MFQFNASSVADWGKVVQSPPSLTQLEESFSYMNNMIPNLAFILGRESLPGRPWPPFVV